MYKVVSEICIMGFPYYLCYFGTKRRGIVINLVSIEHELAEFGCLTTLELIFHEHVGFIV